MNIYTLCTTNSSLLLRWMGEGHSFVARSYIEIPAALPSTCNIGAFMMGTFTIIKGSYHQPKNVRINPTNFIWWSDKIPPILPPPFEKGVIRCPRLGRSSSWIIILG